MTKESLLILLRILGRPLLGCLLIIVSNTVSVAQKVVFESQIWPILKSRCHECHNADNREGQLGLDSKTSFIKGGVSGKLLAEQELEKSLLLERMMGKGDLPRMPLDDNPLSRREIDLMKRWLSQGAKWPAKVGKKIDVGPPHWAYQPPLKTNPPKTNLENGARSPIDLFIDRKLQSNSLSFSPEASKEKLVRRVYLDLIGLPPSFEELDSFLTDKSPFSYERLVDQLLCSPQFGIKWGRNWLDLARYADTNGFQADQFRSVWPYRDWVIDALNQDMPYDRFSIEQLAGDLLPNPTIRQKTATGFHRLTTCNVEAGVDPEENRINQIIDRVNTTGTVWFGTTFECSQCHNHKYDPFTQREYYQLFAFFNNTPLEVKDTGNTISHEFYGPKMDLPLSSTKENQRKIIAGEIKQLEAEAKKMRVTIQDEFPSWLNRLSRYKLKKETWIPLQIIEFHTKAGTPHQLLADHSVLVGGEAADKDVYFITCQSSLPEINGFRFETLTDPSLAEMGPGRNKSGPPNFVLQEARAYLGSQNDKAIELSDAIADFSQQQWNVSGIIDGRPNTGWGINPEFSKPHWASVATKESIRPAESKTRIRFELDQNHGGGRTIGRLRISALVGKREQPSIPNNIKNIARLEQKSWSAKQKKQIEDFYLNSQPEFRKLSAKVTASKQRLAGLKVDTTLVMKEMDRRTSFVLKRGNFLDRGVPVAAATPSILHPGPSKKRMNRLDLARWIFDKKNPLTSRVAVNRWWAEIFGQGIVTTSEDFGTQGEKPTHPKLLDWLAIEFSESGWSVKQLLRSIVLSKTYRQSSNLSPEKRKKDPQNQLHSRGPRFRLPAEIIRDNALKISGALSSKLSGPPVFPPQPEGIWRHVGRNEPKYQTSIGTDRYRRGIYVFWRRSAPYASFVNFDAPDRTSCVVSRSRTNTPLQALTLLNDEAYQELCLEFAKCILDMNVDSDQDKIQIAFRTCTARFPNPDEQRFLDKFLSNKRRQLVDSPEKVKLLTSMEANKRSVEIAAWMGISQILFNLDETISKD
jgi:hypothetical protein